MATFFDRENNLSISELEELMRITEDEINKDSSKQ
jgi:hypothetical protein